MIDNLPGLPDNLRFNGQDRFWVALYSPRNPLLDSFAGYPLLRKVMVRALTAVPKPIERKAFVLGLDTQRQGLHRQLTGWQRGTTHRLPRRGVWRLVVPGARRPNTSMARVPLQLG